MSTSLTCPVGPTYAAAHGHIASVLLVSLHFWMSTLRTVPHPTRSAGPIGARELLRKPLDTRRMIVVAQAKFKMLVLHNTLQAPDEH